MATDWDAETIEAYNDFKEEGFEITIRVEGSAGTFDPVTKTYSGGSSDVDYVTYGLKKKYNIHDIDGTMIKIHDTKLFFPAYGSDSSGTLGPLPDLTTDNTILIGGEVLEVINLFPIDPGNETILYEAQIRG